MMLQWPLSKKIRCAQNSFHFVSNEICCNNRRMEQKKRNIKIFVWHTKGTCIDPFSAFSFQIALQHSFFGHVVLFTCSHSLYAPSVGVHTKGILNIIVCYFSINEKLKGKMYHLLCLCSLYVDSSIFLFPQHHPFFIQN